MIRAGTKTRSVRMPVGPTGNHSQSALRVSVGVRDRGYVSLLTVIPLAHEACDEIAQHQRIPAGFGESRVQSRREVVAVRAHLHAERCQSHGFETGCGGRQA
jgi:hypothetical protein